MSERQLDCEKPRYFKNLSDSNPWLDGYSTDGLLHPERTFRYFALIGGRTVIHTDRNRRSNRGTGQERVHTAQEKQSRGLPKVSSFSSVPPDLINFDDSHF